MKKILTVVMGFVVALAASAVALPSVSSTSTEPNVWTSNIDGVRAAAQATGYPIFLCVINDDNNCQASDACSHCALLVANTLTSSGFAELNQKYRFYTVLLNCYAGAMGYSSQAVSYYNSYNVGQWGILPTVVLFNASFVRVGAWGYPTTDGTGMSDILDAELQKLCVVDTNLTLEEGVSTVRMGTPCTVNVIRTGASGKTGTVSLALAGDAASQYMVEPQSIAWGAEDGTQSFVVTGGAGTSSGLIQEDCLTVMLQATGFDGSPVAYGTQAKTLVFTDTRVEQTLDEINAAIPGLTLARAGTQPWFRPVTGTLASEDCALGVLTTGTDAMTVTATQGGILTLELTSAILSPYLPGRISAELQSQSGEVETFDLVEGESVRVGLAVGDVLTFSVDAGADQTREPGLTAFLLKTFDFKPLMLALAAPPDGVRLSWSALQSDPSLATLKFAASGLDSVTNYEVFGLRGEEGNVLTGVPIYSGDATEVNAFTLGLVDINLKEAVYQWGVKAYCTNVDVGQAVATAVASFKVSALPVYEGKPTSVSAYLKVRSRLDFSAILADTSATTVYTAQGLPRGLTIDSATGLISGTPAKKGTYQVTVTAQNEYGNATTVFTLTVGKFPTTNKGTYFGIGFDADQELKASAKWTVATSGKVKLSVSRRGKTTSYSGVVEADVAGDLRFVTAGGTLERQSGNVWGGTVGDLTIYGTLKAKITAPLKGSFKAALGERNGQEGSFKVKVLSSGRVSLSGKTADALRISASGQGVKFPADFIVNHLPIWNVGSEEIFVYFYKKSSKKPLEGGLVVSATGIVSSNISYAGRVYVGGSRK